MAKKLTRKDIKVGDKFKVNLKGTKLNNTIIEVKKVLKYGSHWDFIDLDKNISWRLSEVIPFKQIKIKETTKYDEGKPDFTLIPQEALLEVAKVFTYGANKYSQDNYSLGTNYRRYIAAANRHINQWLRNQDIDEETQTNHLSNAIASLMMVLDNQLTNKGTDDRNKVYKIK
jgi:hypothetical protein